MSETTDLATATVPEHQPTLTDDPHENTAILRELLATATPGRIHVAAGRHPLAEGLVLTDGWSLHGPPGGLPRATLAQVEPVEQPFVHILGSRCSISDLRLELPAAYPGPHDGDRWTAVTVGQYLYPATADWLADVSLQRIHVLRAGRCAANSIAVMGAVRRIHLAEVHVSGGGTGVAAHWGAPGESVDDLTGPTYHPHQLTIEDLYVRKAFEGFYLSSVHDVTVERARMSGVEIGFRLLPGDNTDRFHESPGESQVSSRISVSDCEIGWIGGLYALRVAGWGQSEVDSEISQLDYRDLTISDIVVHPWPQPDAEATEGRAAVVVENAGRVAFHRIGLASSTDVVPVRLDGEELPLSSLTDAVDRMSRQGDR
ncbi:MAG: hypothetical protein GEV07_09275 [Streptosporangiales bacterium]|nr:hypothetical protein [Streptosporangiales bacterium]